MEVDSEEEEKKKDPNQEWEGSMRNTNRRAVGIDLRESINSTIDQYLKDAENVDKVDGAH